MEISQLTCHVHFKNVANLPNLSAWSRKWQVKVQVRLVNEATSPRPPISRTSPRKATCECRFAMTQDSGFLRLVWAADRLGSACVLNPHTQRARGNRGRGHMTQVSRKRDAPKSRLSLRTTLLHTCCARQISHASRQNDRRFWTDCFHEKLRRWQLGTEQLSPQSHCIGPAANATQEAPKKAGLLMTSCCFIIITIIIIINIINKNKACCTNADVRGVATLLDKFTRKVCCKPCKQVYMCDHVRCCASLSLQHDFKRFRVCQTKCFIADNASWICCPF